MPHVHPVTLARHYAGITQTELARRLKRTQPFVARLEDWDYDIKPLSDDLSKALGLPPSFFLGEEKWLMPESAVSFRKRSRCPAFVRNKAEFYAIFASAVLVPMIKGFVQYPAVDIPQHPVRTAASTEHARSIGASIAKSVRAEWGIGWGPIADVFRLLEFKGVRLFFVKEQSDHLDGFACWTHGNPFIFLNTEVLDPARLRLDAAHELGHLIMHRDIEMDARTDILEAMAFGFASEFLAPWETIKKEVPVVPEIDRLSELRARWKISMQAIVKHMYSNKSISEASYTNAFRKFSTLGYRRSAEPGWMESDSSAIHEKFVDIVNELDLSIASIGENYGVPERVLAEMIPATVKSDILDFMIS